MEKDRRQETGAEEPPAQRDAVVGLARVMEKVADKVMDRMMERVMDRLVEKWKMENKERIQQTVVETMNETIDKVAKSALNAEEEMGRKVEELVNKVVLEVAAIMEMVMEQVEQKLDREKGALSPESSSGGSVCEMPPYDDMDEEEDDDDDDDEEMFQEPPLTPNQREAFYEVFGQFTQSNSDIIDFSSLKSALTGLEIPVEEVDVYDILEALDSNGDGEANFDDFLNTVTNTRLFFYFYKELPERCEGSQPQTGSVDNTVFFEILSKFIQTQMLSEDTTRKIIRYYYMKKKGAKIKSKKLESCHKQLIPPPTFLGQSVYSLANYVDILEPDEDYKEAPLTEEQVKAFRDVFDMFCRDKQDSIDVNSLLNMMSEVQIYLKNPLIPNEMKCTEVNSGKEVTFEDFLAIMTDTDLFAQYLAPELEECKGTVATPVVMLQAVNKLVDSPLLSAKSKGIIAAYYRSKFINMAQSYGDGADLEEDICPTKNEDDKSEEPQPPNLRSLPRNGSGDPEQGKEDAKAQAKEAAKQQAIEAAKEKAREAAAEAAKEQVRKSHSRKIKEAKLKRRQNMQRRFEAAMRNPAFHQAFNAYSWTWNEKQNKQKQSGVQCPENK